MTQELLDRVLQSPRLPSLPTIALEVIELVQQQDVNIKQIANTIQHDPALSSKILKTVNSSFYAQAHSISTVSHALVVLGLNAVKTLALGFSLVGNLKDQGGEDFDHVDYWRRSLYSATAAKALSAHAGIVQQEECFLGGLLQDMGMVVLAQTLGREYVKLLRQAKGDHARQRELELEAYGIDHAGVGAALAEQWHLPPLLVAPVRWHEQPDGAPEEVLPLVRCVALGNRVADVFMHEEGDGDALEQLHRQAHDWFGICPDQAAPLLKLIHGQTREMSRLFDLPTGNLGNPDQILARANEALMTITLQAQLQSTQLEQQNQQLATEANTDSLTGAANRRAFDEYVHEQFDAVGEPTPLSVLFMDVDKFKLFNDTHGHAVGDRVLVVFAQTLEETVGQRGRVFRYGGEEFAIICPETDRRTAAALAEQVRLSVERDARVASEDGQELSITCSVGVATHDGTFFDKAEHLVKAADQGVYAAKAAGRNAVRVFTPRRKAAAA